MIMKETIEIAALIEAAEDLKNLYYIARNYKESNEDYILELAVSDNKDKKFLIYNALKARDYIAECYNEKIKRL